MTAPQVRSVPAPLDGFAANALSRLDFSDAYAVELPPGVDASALAAAVFASAPPWVVALMAVRHMVVAPLGLIATPGALRRAAVAQNLAGELVGAFPVLARSTGEVLLGLDDRHLDFRVSVRVVAQAGQPPLGVVATYVRLNRWLGSAYFAAVKPFHRVIVPAMLRRAARRLALTR
ncbi:MAG: DUF2867 domain-containing protein [Anaeromyxobacter sp.]